MVAASKHPVSPTKQSHDLSARLWSEDLPREHAFERLEVEGTLPAELRGTLYRNGPALFGQRGVRYSHPFEGDGGVTAIRFEGGRAFGASKITESAGLREERGAGHMLYGLKVPWLRRVTNMMRNRQKNTANTNVVMWQGRLYALMEAALPTEIDPINLATRGETNLDRTIVAGERTRSAQYRAITHHVESVIRRLAPQDAAWTLGDAGTTPMAEWLEAQGQSSASVNEEETTA